MMMRFVIRYIIVVFVLTIASCSMRIDILFIGDSLVEGGDWGHSMQPFSSKNLGVGGFRSTDLLSNDMMAKVAQNHPDQIVVMVGINDLMNGVSPDSLAKNYAELFMQLDKICPSTIIHAVVYQGHDRIQDEIRTVNQFLQSYAHQHERIFIDLNQYLSDDEVLKPEFTTDGIHLTAPAYKIWEEELKKVLHQTE